MFKVVYMTGAPASGKSSTASELKMRVANLDIFEYGARLTDLVARRQNRAVIQEDIREHSSNIISKRDVDELDEVLIEYCFRERSLKHVIIDSHAVTKESFGFRVTAFSSEQIKKIAPSEIWVLYAGADETIRRISANSGGRPTPSSWEADFHTQVQANLAVTYGVLTGTATYLFDTTMPRDQLFNNLAKRLAN